ncbi:MAG: SPFH domain-containing protein [Calditrichia bacterium]
MFGFKFAKFNPSTYVFQYQKGQIIREGHGLSFFYFAPTSSLVAIPTESKEMPFIFEETTSDFQTITIQGQLTWRIKSPHKTAECLDYSLNPRGDYQCSDNERLPQRLIAVLQVLIRAELRKTSLREAMGVSDSLSKIVLGKLSSAPELEALGLEIMGLAILAVRPTPETARALEAEMREKLLQEADDAIYIRRNSAIAQERAIKENELNTEIAIENKKQQIEKTRIAGKQEMQAKKFDLEKASLAFKQELENDKTTLIKKSAENGRIEADTRIYELAKTLDTLKTIDAGSLQALASVGMAPGQMVALAFQELAENAQRIGQLNITPDLLKELITPQNS